MVSSAAEPRVRRTMGDEFALGDAVARAEIIDIGLDDAVHVAERVRVVGEAFLRVGPEDGRGDDVQLHEARRPAEAAIGLTPER